MSVLIKGMKMPESCAECKKARLQFYIKCEEHEYVSNGLQMKMRSLTCPMTELPAEHGDLIDRDTLSRSLESLCDRVCQYSKAQRKVMCGACPLGDAFAVVEDDAPTIIEAEEG